MELTEILTPDLALANQDIASKKRALQEAAERLAAADPELDALAIYDALTERERLGTTALGFGVALPHCRLPGCTRPHGLLLQTREGIDFGATDRVPVRLLFVLVVPEAATDEHLQILALLAGAFSQSSYREALLAAETADALYKAALARPVAEQSA